MKLLKKARILLLIFNRKENKKRKKNSVLQQMCRGLFLFLFIFTVLFYFSLQMCNFSIDLNRYKRASFLDRRSVDNRHISETAEQVVICLFVMDLLIKASHDFEQVTNDFDEKLFLKFMKKITIWDFFDISKEKYLAMSEQEKRVKISQYYSDMKSKGTGEFCFVLFVV